MFVHIYCQRFFKVYFTLYIVFTSGKYFAVSCPSYGVLILQYKNIYKNHISLKSAQSCRRWMPWQGYVLRYLHVQPWPELGTTHIQNLQLNCELPFISEFTNKFLRDFKSPLASNAARSRQPFECRDLGWGLLNQFPLSLYFLDFHYRRKLGHLLNITLKFDRRSRSTASVTFWRHFSCLFSLKTRFVWIIHAVVNSTFLRYSSVHHHYSGQGFTCHKWTTSKYMSM